MALYEKTAAELGRMLASKEVSAVEVASAFVDRAQSLEPEIGAYLTGSDQIDWKTQAESAQSKIDSGTVGPLTGIPIAVKDNISTMGVKTTCASKILETYVPPFDATVVQRYQDAGMVMLGKANLDEFAMGASTERSAYHVTKNPWDTDRSPGGSSGGSAAAVAAKMVPVSLGSDTGGSIRQPAALCGIVGFKPTYGRVSRYGLVAFGSSLDQIGPMGQTVEDCALVYEAISGHDPMDSTSIPEPAYSSASLKSGSLKGLKIALPKELFSDASQPGVLASIYEAVETLKREGVEFVEVSVPEIELGVTTYYIIAPAEASSNLARFDGVRFGPRVEGGGHVGEISATRGALFGHEVKSRIMIGTYVLSAGYYDAFYHKAQQIRGKMAENFEKLFQDVDLILGPTSPIVAFKCGELLDDPLALKLVDYCTIPANMGGFPAISLPSGLSEGLPVGMQLMGAVKADERVLQAAYVIEQALGVKLNPPR
jgi:aspartyl-tRNA(Asn)/glutamyl-tRNA(Gln) amidotransferase subunit A